MFIANARRSTQRNLEVGSLARRTTGCELTGLLKRIVELLDAAQRASARAVNALIAATYWEIGRRIVEREQRGAHCAGYGEELLARLPADLTRRVGRDSAWTTSNVRGNFTLPSISQ